MYRERGIPQKTAPFRPQVPFHWIGSYGRALAGAVYSQALLPCDEACSRQAQSGMIALCTRLDNASCGPRLLVWAEERLLSNPRECFNILSVAGTRMHIYLPVNLTASHVSIVQQLHGFTRSSVRQAHVHISNGLASMCTCSLQHSKARSISPLSPKFCLDFLHVHIYMYISSRRQ